MFEGSRREFFDLLASHDEVPAFVHRAHAVEFAKQQLLATCETRRQELLDTARMRLAQLYGLVGGDWQQLHQWLLSRDHTAYLEQLHAAWQPLLRLAVVPTSSQAKLRRAVLDLDRSFTRFNRRWEQFVAEVDLAAVNAAREAYNKYYVLEKACAFGNERLARIGFRKLPPMTPGELLVELPPLRTSGR